MRKLFGILLLLAAVLVCTKVLPMETEARTIASGPISQNLEYTIDDEGVMIISGNGRLIEQTWGGEYYRNLVKLVYIGEGVTEIGDKVFSNCSNLEGIYIPKTMKEIGNAFENCDKLSLVYISDISSWCKIDFSGEGPTPLMKAGKLYLNGSLVKDLIIPNDVTKISPRAFDGCTSLTSVTISARGEIGWGAFAGCTNLQSVDIAEGVTTIGSSAFSNCSKITHLTLPEGLKKIEQCAFQDSLDNLDSLNIPDSVTVIEVCAFANSGVKEVKLPTNLTRLEAATFCESDIEKIVLPEGLTYIGASAFEGTRIAEIVLPEGLTYIGESAFAYSCLESITIPVSVTEIGEWAFAYASSPEIYYEGSQKQWEKLGVSPSLATRFTVHFAINCDKGHTWDGGAITEKATCGKSGTKTYTCTVCGDTKKETLTQLAAHTYDSNCDEKCNVCGAGRSVTHSYGTWEKSNNGQHKRTCTVCLQEEIQKHTYDNACDTSCNICNATRTINHDYKTSWSKDKTNHWHECSVCKDKKDMAAHTPGAAATETTAQSCTACGYIIKPILGHKHNYAATWTTDENGHWYACAGCEEQGNYVTHDFENACDKDCSICGYTRETSHNYPEDWNSDKNNHWHGCTGCGLKQDEAAHEPGAEATETTAQTCTICGYEIAPALGEKDTESATTPVAPTEPVEPSADPTVWIIVAIAVVLLGGSAAGIIIWKKKH